MAGATSSLDHMATKTKVLQAVVAERHARQFREIVARKGRTVSAELYRYVLQVIKKDYRRKGIAAFPVEEA